MELTILLVLLYIVVNLIIGWLMENAAAMKGYGKEVHAFVACFWLSFLGCIYIASLPDKIQQGQNQRILELLEKQVSQ